MVDRYDTIDLDPRIGAAAAVWNGPTRIVGIAAGGRHNLLLTESGHVLASGSNERNQIDVPARLSDVVAIAAGYAHSLALRRDGTVAAWGNNSRGATAMPSGLADVVAIAAGGGHSVAVRSDGSVVFWGQLGNTAGDPLEGPSNVVAATSGWESCYLLRSDGTVSVWGQTDSGPSSVPEDLTGVRFISGGGGPAALWVAAKFDGSVEEGVNQTRRIAQKELRQVMSVSAGEMHCVALHENGTISGWGHSPVRQNVPDGLRDATAVSAGANHTLALRSDGTVIAWGKNAYNQISGPHGYTVEACGWEGEGYYLPSLASSLRTPTQSQSTDPYAKDYGQRPSYGGGNRERATPRLSWNQDETLRKQLVDAIDKAVTTTPGDLAGTGRAVISGSARIHEYFYSAQVPDRELWRSLFEKVTTEGPWAGSSQNLLASKLIEVAGRLDWAKEVAFARATISESTRVKSKQQGGCYIATEVYGAYDCPEVWVLRRFRDQTLMKVRAGRRLVRIYYRVSPVAVRVGGTFLRQVARWPLAVLVAGLQKRGVADTPYFDRRSS